MIDRAFAREKKKDVFIQDALAEPSPRGIDPLQVERVPLLPQDVIQRALTSPPVCGTFTEHFGTCGRVWRPREGQRLSSSAEILP
jgi:hypothetical protein